jgi:mannitol/fructose-specific phosphotransferase system IIA component (Ntr-type)
LAQDDGSGAGAFVVLLDYAAADLVALDLAANDKQELLQKLVDLLLPSGRIRDSAHLMGELLKRER